MTRLTPEHRLLAVAARRCGCRRGGRLAAPGRPLPRGRRSGASPPVSDRALAPVSTPPSGAGCGRAGRAATAWAAPSRAGPCAAACVTTPTTLSCETSTYGPHDRDPGQLPGGAADLDHLADGQARGVGPAALRPERDQRIADAHVGHRVEQLELQRVLPTGARRRCRSPRSPATRPPTADEASTMSTTVDVLAVVLSTRPTRPSPLMTVMSFSMPSLRPASMVIVHEKSCAGPDGDHLGGDEPVAAHAGDAQQPVERIGPGPVVRQRLRARCAGGRSRSARVSIWSAWSRMSDHQLLAPVIGENTVAADPLEAAEDVGRRRSARPPAAPARRAGRG